MITTSYDSLKAPTPSCDHVNSSSFAPQSDKSSTVSSSESSSERSSHLASSRTPIYLGTTCLYIFLVIHSKVSLISFAVNCHSCPLWSTQKNTDSKASTRNVVGDETRLETSVILSILSFDTDGVDFAPSWDQRELALVPAQLLKGPLWSCFVVTEQSTNNCTCLVDPENWFSIRLSLKKGTSSPQTLLSRDS